MSFELEIGMKIEALVDGEWHSGVISKLFKNGKIRVNFDSGGGANVMIGKLRVVSVEDDEYYDNDHEYGENKNYSEENDDDRKIYGSSFDTVLKYIGFIAIVIAVIVRFGMSYFTGTNFLSYVDTQLWEKIIIGCCIALFCVSVWHTFLRRRCPECNSTSYHLMDDEELDRWLGTKKVSERTASGKTKTRHVQTTYVKMKREYLCNDCHHKWVEIDKEEK